MPSPCILVRRKPGLEHLPESSIELPMWSEQVVVGDEVLCSCFWAHGSDHQVLLVNRIEPPKQMLDAGWRLVGWSGSVPVMRKPDN